MELYGSVAALRVYIVVEVGEDRELGIGASGCCYLRA